MKHCGLWQAITLWPRAGYNKKGYRVALSKTNLVAGVVAMGNESYAVTWRKKRSVGYAFSAVPKSENKDAAWEIESI